MLLAAQALAEDRKVGDTRIPTPAGEIWVSTVFLAMDMNHHAVALDLDPAESPPLLFETAIFWPEIPGIARFADGVEIAGRYATWEEAEAGHRMAIESVRQQIAQFCN